MKKVRVVGSHSSYGGDAIFSLPTSTKTVEFVSLVVGSKKSRKTLVACRLVEDRSKLPLAQSAAWISLGRRLAAAAAAAAVGGIKLSLKSRVNSTAALSASASTPLSVCI